MIVLKFPLEDEREHWTEEQEKILIDLNLSNVYIMNVIWMEFEADHFVVEPELYRKRKNILRIYKCLQVLIEWNFEVFMKLALFKKVIFKIWTKVINQYVVVVFIRAGMELTISKC